MDLEISFPAVVAQPAIDQLVQVADQIWREHYLPIIGQAQIDYMLDRFQSAPAIEQQLQQGYRYHFISTADQPCGYLSFARRQDGLFLSKIYLERQQRGKGLGWAAMDFVQRQALEQGLDRIWLTVNRNNRIAIEAYRRWGFNVVGEVVQDIGQGFVMDDYRMELALV